MEAGKISFIDKEIFSLKGKQEINLYLTISRLILNPLVSYKSTQVRRMKKIPSR